MGAVRERADRHRRRAARAAPARREPRRARARSFDIAGAVSVTAGLALLVYTLVDANDAGWGSTQTLVLGAVSLALLAVVRRDRAAHAPPAGAVLDLPAADAARRERRRAAARHVAVLDVLLHLAVHAAGAGLRAAQGRARLPAAGRCTIIVSAGVGVRARHAHRLQADADRGDAVHRRRPRLVRSGERARRHVRRRRPVPVAARGDRPRARVRPGRRSRAVTGITPGRGRPRVRAHQHLAAGRRRARPGGPRRGGHRHDRRRARLGRAQPARSR